jgi:hypothetical protein
VVWVVEVAIVMLPTNINTNQTTAWPILAVAAAAIMVHGVAQVMADQVLLLFVM